MSTITSEIPGVGLLPNYAPGEFVYADEPTERRPGFCRCGCGGRTPPATRNRAESDRGAGNRQIKGQPTRYILGHGHRRNRPLFIVNALTGCWVWCWARNPKGYGITRKQGTGNFAHRMMYERYIGPVPDGLELDHLCMNRLCVNPLHLEAVTHQENMRRAGLMT